jgi:hypothetical protein
MKHSQETRARALILGKHTIDFRLKIQEMGKIFDAGSKLNLSFREIVRVF